MRLAARTLALLVLALASALASLCPGPAGAASSIVPPPWETPAQLSDHGMLGDVAMAGDWAAVTWTENHAVKVGYRLPDRTWEVAAVGHGGRPRVAVNEDGQAAVTWHRRDGDARRVLVAQRPAGGPWTAPATLAGSARDPVVAVSPTGTVTVLALRWRAHQPRTTAVLAFTYTSAWSAPTQLSNREDLRLGPGMRRSLAVTTDPDGRLVAAWKCDRQACVRFPGWRGPIDLVPGGHLAVAVSPDGRPFLATRFAVSELVEPGFVEYQGWSVPATVGPVTLDVGLRERGVASWTSIRPDRPLWVSSKPRSVWETSRPVARHAHGLGGVTLVEPNTGLAFWRTGSGRLRTAARLPHQAWAVEGVLGNDVENARLVSDAGAEALLAWSSGGPEPGVYVAARTAP